MVLPIFFVHFRKKYQEDFILLRSENTHKDTYKIINNTIGLCHNLLNLADRNGGKSLIFLAMPHGYESVRECSIQVNLCQWHL